LIGAKGTNREQKPGWGVTYTARVCIIVLAGGLLPLIREGSGAGHGIDTDLGQAHESALKEAETDAMKRALITFGNPFGLALYDKSQRQVSGNGQGQSQSQGQWQGQGPSQARSAPQVQALSRPQSPSPVPAAHRQQPTSSPAQRLSPLANPVAAAFNGPARSQGSSYGNGNGTSNGQADGAQNPTAGASAPAATARPQTAPTSAAAARTAATARLDPATIEALQKRIRALLPPQLAAFSRAFRSAFQVPDATPSIAGLITEQRHLAWIQHYLTQIQGQGQGHSQSQGQQPSPRRLSSPDCSSPQRGPPGPAFPLHPSAPCAPSSPRPGRPARVSVRPILSRSGLAL
jgi:hypothetical protein